MTQERRISRVRYTFYVFIICCSTVICYLGFFRGMRFFAVPSDSMIPTLYRGDYLLTLNAPEYQRGDLVVLKDPARDGGNLVKRIIGVGGDMVAIQAGALFINGKYASEPYTKEPMVYEVFPPVTVPQGRVFVLGDNRNDSEDSSYWANAKEDPGISPELRADPTVSVDDIIGKVRYIYLPVSRWGPVASYPLSATLAERRASQNAAP
ncbi:MAG TPA: signal peptidase I [Candidatus Hydrogenedentes bacterium]|nr:signal peptidase I [Candidatus Hydrogenedentota bacterium]HQE82364.1 signal peptidase I [Candidatus Hydrogenedentota bacterium]HQH54645.1 signal peptidase I [Candidatus Hydrogenedentota bacterium]HQM47185.1 signal peptidase I [Candidatus Hydrogenedentota bacterium]